MPNYTTTRPKQTLLNQGAKQPLRTSPDPKTLNPSTVPASVVFQSSSSSTRPRSPPERNRGMGSEGGDAAQRTQEVDIAGAVQQFLDPVGWDQVKRVGQARAEGGERDGDADEEGRRKRRQGRKEAEEEERRKREREAEFGGMAVRGRMRGR